MCSSAGFLRSALAAGALALLAACDGGGPTESKPKEPDGIKVISGGELGDTAQAIRPELLKVRVTSGGKPAANAAIEFAGLPLVDCAECTIPTVETAPGNLLPGGPLLTVTADANGEASVVVRLGTVAGGGRLRVRVAALGLENTLSFTVQPGRAVATRVLPRDSAIYLNTTAHLRAAVVDRHGNVRPEPATLSVGGGLTLAGDFATGTAYGVGRVTVSAPGLPADSTQVVVVPHGTLAAVTSYRGSAIALFDLDGSHRTNLAFTGQVHGMDWAPDGTRLVVSLGDAVGPRKLYSVTPAGAQTQLFAGSPLTDASRPVFSADGQWLYFVGATTPVGFGQFQIWRARGDGTGLERVGAEPEPVKSVAPSPDGSRVAYSRASFSDPLQILTVATGQVSSFGIATEGVRWSPKADRLSLRQIGGPATVNTDGTGFRTYTGYHGLDDPFAPWSPDGSWIAYDNGGSLELIQVETGLRIPLRFTAGFTQAAWKP